MNHEDYYEEGDPPTRHCPGPAIPESHGCGRWVSRAGDLCTRCVEESDSYWAEDIAREKQIQATYAQRQEEIKSKWGEAWEQYKKQNPPTRSR